MTHTTPASEVTWTISGHTYTQRPIGLDRTGSLFKLLSRAVSLLKATGKLDQLESLNTEDTSGVIALLASSIEDLPLILSEFVVIALDAEGDEKEATHLKKNCNLSQAMRIVSTFADQNDLADLWQSFLALFQKLRITSKK